MWCQLSDQQLPFTIGDVALVAIPWTTSLVPYLQVKSLQLIWRSGIRRFHLRVPDLQMSCRDLITWQGTRIVAPTMAARWRAPLWGEVPGQVDSPYREPVTMKTPPWDILIMQMFLLCQPCQDRTMLVVRVTGGWTEVLCVIVLSLEGIGRPSVGDRSLVNSLWLIVTALKGHMSSGSHDCCDYCPIPCFSIQ